MRPGVAGRPSELTPRARRVRTREARLRAGAWLGAATVCAAIGVGLTAGNAGCGSSTCPFPKASPATIDPAQSCLDAKVTSCLHATLTVKNLCTDPLYISTDYGTFPNASPGQEVEILPGSTITYEVRQDKATAKTSDREDYVVPGRVGSTAITFAFFIEKS